MGLPGRPQAGHWGGEGKLAALLCLVAGDSHGKRILRLLVGATKENYESS